MKFSITPLPSNLSESYLYDLFKYSYLYFKKGHPYKHTSNKASPLNDFSVKELNIVPLY